MICHPNSKMLVLYLASWTLTSYKERRFEFSILHVRRFLAIQLLMITYEWTIPDDQVDWENSWYLGSNKSWIQLIMTQSCADNKKKRISGVSCSLFSKITLFISTTAIFPYRSGEETSSILFSHKNLHANNLALVIGQMIG